MHSYGFKHLTLKQAIMQTKIIIPEPCHEDWNKMTPTEKGAFCSSCAKEVKDFTKSSDREILEVLNTSEDQICGHINTHQLNRNLEAETQPSTVMNWKIPFAASFTLLATAVAAQTQQSLTEIKALGNVKTSIKGDVKVEKVKVGKMKMNRYKNVEPVFCKLPQTKIRGEIARIDTPVVEEEIRVEGLIIHVEEPDTVKKMEPKVTDTVLPKPTPKADTISISSAQDTIQFKQPVSTVPEDTNSFEKPNIDLKINTYPNPTKDWITIQVQETGLYNVNIMNANGGLVLKKSFYGTALKINLSNQASGIYYIQTTTSAGIRSKTLKIIKQ